jgi:hypothetical protein
MFYAFSACWFISRCRGPLQKVYAQRQVFSCVNMRVCLCVIEKQQHVANYIHASLWSLYWRSILCIDLVGADLHAFLAACMYTCHSRRTAYATRLIPSEQREIRDCAPVHMHMVFMHMGHVITHEIVQP